MPKKLEVRQIVVCNMHLVRERPIRQPSFAQLVLTVNLPKGIKEKALYLTGPDQGATA